MYARKGNLEAFVGELCSGHFVRLPSEMKGGFIRRDAWFEQVRDSFRGSFLPQVMIKNVVRDAYHRSSILVAVLFQRKRRKKEEEKKRREESSDNAMVTARGKRH